MWSAISLKLDDRWLPKSVLCLRDYKRSKFVHDIVAGITVGLVALPLAMAFAIASGLTPQAGIYCAIVTGFLISALGGSKTQIGGPTGAFVVVVAGIVAAHGIDGLFMCTVMAGMILVILGATGMGTAVKFIPRPVVIGFTNGIAVLIASTQIKDFIGLHLDKVPSEFWLRMRPWPPRLPPGPCRPRSWRPAPWRPCWCVGSSPTAFPDRLSPCWGRL
jgi:SulP family sulfate permease